MSRVTDEARHRLAELRARAMIRVARRTFKRRPSALDRLAQRLLAKVAGAGDAAELDPDLEHDA